MDEREERQNKELPASLDVRVFDEAVGLWLGLRLDAARDPEPARRSEPTSDS